jgi:hypothetical protein
MAFYQTHHQVQIIKSYLIDGVAGIALANPNILAGGASQTVLVLLNKADTFKMLALALLNGTSSFLISAPDHCLCGSGGWGRLLP